ncbi:MAG: hypothetical protein GY708_29095 [Actinomycetia bacterium]|nr:hypothetical protein [Actinomycetes bacterium]MCP3939423.1 hypothetical protein [Actinomycetes bacterium]MCP4084906.1 hypothetical protein [Actinomycetes bacterium]
MSAHTESPTALRVPALALGVTLAALGISGFLDDSNALPHPPWTIAVIGVITASAIAVIHTARQLVISPHQDAEN